MCEKPSNYLVLESQFSNGLKLFIVLLSTSPQPTLQPVRLRNCSGGGGAAYYCTLPRSGYRARAGVVNSFPTEYYSNTAQCFAAGRQRVTHKQVFVVAALSRILLEQTALYPPPARHAVLPRYLARAAAVAGGPAAFSPFIQEQNVWSIYLLETTKNTNCYLSRILNSSSILHCPHQTATFTRPNIYNWGCVCFKYVGNLVEFLKSLLFQV